MGRVPRGHNSLQVARMLRRLLLPAALTAALLAAAPAPATEQIVRFDAAKMPRAAVAKRLAAAGADVTLLRRLPFALVSGDARTLRRTRRSRGVVSAHPNGAIAYDLHESSPLVYGGAPARTAAWSSGFDGRGETVAVIDTGVDGLHPDLAKRVRRNVKIVGTDGIATEGVFAQPIECPVACTTDTTGGHGTHVAGIAVGDGSASGGFNTGVAPGASVVGISIGEGVATFHALAAYDYLLAHRDLGVVAVNNSFGPAGGGRFDANDPMNVATKALHAAGIAVVFSGGNNGPGPEKTPEGASDCSPRGAADACKSNPWGLAPWAMSVANTRKDAQGGPGDQPLSFYSSRGDPDPQPSLDGKYTIRYGPTLAAPGTNIRSARALNGTSQLTCGGSAEPSSCVPPAPEYELFYSPLSGSSMAAPHVVGAIAVVQSAARARLGRRLTPDEVRSLLVDTAAPMVRRDALYDFPCGVPGAPCGNDTTGTTNAAYQPWQVGAGALDVGAALRALEQGRFASARPAPAPPPGPASPPSPSSPPAAPPAGAPPVASQQPAAPRTAATKTKKRSTRRSTVCKRLRTRAARKRCAARQRAAARRRAKRRG